MRILSILLSLMLVACPCFGGVSFNGDADYINVGLNDFAPEFGNGKVSISAWINTTSTITQCLIGTYNGTSGTDQAAFQIEINRGSSLNESGRIFVFVREDVSTTVDLTGYVAIDTGINDGTDKFLYIEIDCSTNTIIVEINGSSQSITYVHQETPSTFNDFAQDVFIGANNNIGAGGNLFFDGRINELYVYGDGLSSSQKETLYKGKIKRIGLQFSPFAYYPLDDYADGTALNTDADGYKDLSGNGNHGTGVDADGNSTNVAETILSYPPN